MIHTNGKIPTSKRREDVDNLPFVVIMAMGAPAMERSGQNGPG